MARRKKVIEDNYDTSITTEQSHAEVETTGPETINGVIANWPLVRVRSKPSKDSDVLEVLREGDRVHIHEKVGEFYRVSTSVNKEAYIMEGLVKEV